ncbi:mediator of RNA polymerase II transcription subunit 11 [Cucumis melo var. makuwa]|uniref:Mediator of RNA polymerase II transcription subunit 11 n=1 Tax=Cucumis melo var. makuwa TaxID=1194695 RepID=A0A5D3C2G2_CUCMM|nr:mediator of RNA polymerase II transcription subunit 11 [Cucumis melo var. makuwa]TYK05378.1 mediator of RNA polymerase II transcription subunit 11 [Cucumis melo var. makuwa]
MDPPAQNTSLQRLQNVEKRIVRVLELAGGVMEELANPAGPRKEFVNNHCSEFMQFIKWVSFLIVLFLNTLGSVGSFCAATFYLDRGTIRFLEGLVQCSWGIFATTQLNSWDIKPSVASSSILSFTFSLLWGFFGLVLAHGSSKLQNTSYTLLHLAGKRPLSCGGCGSSTIPSCLKSPSELVPCSDSKVSQASKDRWASNHQGFFRGRQKGVVVLPPDVGTDIVKTLEAHFQDKISFNPLYADKALIRLSRRNLEDLVETPGMGFNSFLSKSSFSRNPCIEFNSNPSLALPIEAPCSFCRNLPPAAGSLSKTLINPSRKKGESSFDSSFGISNEELEFSAKSSKFERQKHYEPLETDLNALFHCKEDLKSENLPFATRCAQLAKYQII